jgi:cellobiose transport system permease protein
VSTQATAVVPVQRRRHVGRNFQSAGPGTYAFLVLVALVSAFPLYWSFVVASHDNSAVANYPPAMLPGSNFWHNLKLLFNSGAGSGADYNFGEALVNSTIVATIVTVSTVFFSALAGFAFAKLDFRGRKLLLLVIIGTLTVPPQLGVIPLYVEMIHFGWLYSLKAVTFPFLVTAFGVFLMRQYISTGVPNELIESARVDGCHTTRIFWHVVLPAVRPVAAVLGLLTFMQTWNEFFWPNIVLTTSHSPTVQVVVGALGAGYVPNVSLEFMGAFVSIVPLLLMFLLLGRQIIGGIMQGAVKG